MHQSHSLLIGFLTNPVNFTTAKAQLDLVRTMFWRWLTAKWNSIREIWRGRVEKSGMMVVRYKWRTVKKKRALNNFIGTPMTLIWIHAVCSVIPCHHSNLWMQAAVSNIDNYIRILSYVRPTKWNMYELIHCIWRICIEVFPLICTSNKNLCTKNEENKTTTTKKYETNRNGMKQIHINMTYIFINYIALIFHTYIQTYAYMRNKNLLNYFSFWVFLKFPAQFAFMKSFRIRWHSWPFILFAP